ncbi:hypothetical protein F8S09_07025 [Deinococcus sp. SDU3-2]|uniref:SARP family transcriptional regulator n=1 Tax=Deinococcus terrestris TaxID=2651870 RepID=A0A7X1TR55_9DEIO|nr:hypothetical protein [Deinococcus terrestris]MPY66448.1 hypothetical protein [Deinococcus terrestris]
MTERLRDGDDQPAQQPTLRVLGHVYLWGAGPLPAVSSKGLALLTYLALEARPHHREHLANLLWDTADAMANLRVELVRLRQRGVSLPARQPMLSLPGATDLTEWEALPDPSQGDGEVLEWLAPLRGPVLSGLEDLGTTAFREWLDGQRGALHDRIEARLSRVAGALAARGQASGVRLIEARAEALGLHLSVPVPAALPPAPPEAPEPHPSNSPASGLHWPEPEARLREVLGRILEGHTPHLLLLRGRGGTRRGLIARLTCHTPWQTVQVQASTDPLLWQQSLRLHLRRLLPAASAPAASDPLLDPLLELAGLFSALQTPLLLVLHDLSPQTPGLHPLLSFLLDLPAPIAVMVTVTSEAAEAGLRPLLRRAAGARLEVLNLPPLGVSAVTGALQARRPASLASAALEDDRVLATRLVQCSEGYLPYLDVLLAADPPRLEHRLPEGVRDLLLAELGPLTAPDLDRWARLAQIHGRFDPATAQALLGEGAGTLLLTPTARSVLVPVPRTEALVWPEPMSPQLTWPQLTGRADDAQGHLGFAHELTRSALASLLPPHERHAARRTLARHFQTTDPARSLLYAERAQCPDLAEQARAALPELTAPALPRGPQPRPVPAPEAPPSHAGRDGWTAGGYRVAFEDGRLRILRRGHPGLPPLLTLCFPGSAPAWSLTLRHDLAASGRPAAHWPPNFVLGVRVGSGPRVVYSTEPVPDHFSDGVEHVFGGVLTPGCWLGLSGPGGTGPLELSVRAVDSALTLGALSWGNHRLGGQ